MQSEAEQTLKKKQCMPKENARPEPFHSWFSDIERPNKVEKMSFEKTSAFQLLKIQALCGLLQRQNKNKNLERTSKTVTYRAKNVDTKLIII